MAPQGDIKHQQFAGVKGYLMNLKCKYRLYNPKHDSLYASASLVCAVVQLFQTPPCARFVIFIYIYLIFAALIAHNLISLLQTAERTCDALHV